MDVCGRTRPGANIVLLLKIYTGQTTGDSTFHSDFDAGKARIAAEREAEVTLPSFKPSADVLESRVAGFLVYQDFGCLLEHEFREYTGITVQEAEILPWQGPKPGGWHGATMAYYLVSLNGFGDKAWGMRKARVYFREECHRQEHFLMPGDQLVSDQGRFVAQYVFDKVQHHFPPGFRHDSGTVPESLTALQSKNEVRQGNERLEGRIAARKLGEETDSWDQVMGAGGSDLEASDAEKAESRKKRCAQPPGIQPTSPPREPKKKLAAAKSTSTRATKKRAPSPPPPCKADPSLGETQAGSSADPRKRLKDAFDAEAADTKSASQSKAARQNLDAEMKKVAEDHLSTNRGSSVKCLENLDMETFLCSSSTASSLSAKLRGARALAAPAGFAVLHSNRSNDYDCACGLS